MFSSSFVLTLFLSAVVVSLADELPDESQYLNGHTFSEQHWSTVVDWMDIVRENATDAHVFTNLVYVNREGYQMFYIGFLNATISKIIHILFWDINVTMSGMIPMQSIMQHFKSPNGRDVFLLSTFVMLVEFQDTGTIPDIPDSNEPIYLSLSFDITGSVRRELEGFNFEIFPLQVSEDGNTYTWGMRYKDLKSIWWLFDPSNPGSGHIVAFVKYDHLCFNYTLNIYPEEGVANITTEYSIGQMTWLKVGNEEYTGSKLTEFLRSNEISISLVTYQATISVGVEHKVVESGEEVPSDDLKNITSGVLDTVLGTDEELVASVSFKTKDRYDLFNETSGSYYKKELKVENWIYNLNGMRKSPILALQRIINMPMPIVALYIDPELRDLYESGELNETTLSIEGADCIYVSSYPTWEGLTVIHDPTFTAYFNPEVEGNAKMGTFIAVLALIAVVAAVILIKRR